MGTFSISKWIKTNSDSPGSGDKEAALSKGSVSTIEYTQFNLGFTSPTNGGDDLKENGQLISEGDNYIPTQQYSPQVTLTAGVQEIELTVTDLDGATSSDTVMITVLNSEAKLPSRPRRFSVQ